MRKCTVCGKKAGFLLTMCDACIRATEEAERQEKAAQLSSQTQSSKSFASKIDYSQNLRELPDEKLLRAILLDKAIAGASGSLLIWGTINLGAWYFFREETISTFSKIKAPPGTFNTLIYGGAVIGVWMLVFGALGAIWWSSIVGWLDGISLLVVGGWNMAHDFLLIDAVKPYGYTVKQSSTIWVMLGIGQLIWGGKQLFRFSILGTKPRGIDTAAKKEARAKLTEELLATASPSTGRLNLSITTKQFFPFYVDKTENFTMWLLPERAYCLENGLNRFFEIERHSLKGKQFKGPVVEALDKTDIRRKLLLEASSQTAFNEWLRVE